MVIPTTFIKLQRIYYSLVPEPLVTIAIEILRKEEKRAPSPFRLCSRHLQCPFSFKRREKRFSSAAPQYDDVNKARTKLLPTYKHPTSPPAHQPTTPPAHQPTILKNAPALKDTDERVTKRSFETWRDTDDKAKSGGHRHRKPGWTSMQETGMDFDAGNRDGLRCRNSGCKEAIP
jgi:hypothetical protein